METQMPRSKFVKVKCSCGKEHIIFGSASTEVKCSCSKLLVKPSSGKADIKAKVIRVLE